MTDIAAEAGVVPTRISFVAALNILVSQVRVSGKGAAGNIPRHLKGMRQNVKSFILPEKESTENTIVRCFMFRLNIRSALSYVRLK
ncbi:hypothetical protein FTH80_05250 [Salmonella enterica subsp. enterica]|nr:hypothetical protein [Salmonella enterica subsp. enterica]